MGDGNYVPPGGKVGASDREGGPRISPPLCALLFGVSGVVRG